MLISDALLKLKFSADDQWLQAEALASADEPAEEVNAKYEVAFESYQAVHEQLQTLAVDDLEKMTNADDIVHLYFIYKTLATAYFDMMEFEEAQKLFAKALACYQQHALILKIHVDEKDLHAIHYNVAIAKLKLSEQEEQKIAEPELTEITKALVQDVMINRQSKHYGFSMNRTIEHLLKCKELATGEKVEFLNVAHKQTLVWALTYILNEKQLLNFITSSEKLTTANIASQIPDLSDEQLEKIIAFSPPKRKVDGEITKMVLRMSAFEKTEEFEKLGLHPYQIEAVSQFKQHLEKGKNKGYYTAATGTGKTRIFISQILATGAKSIVLVPSISLIEQTKQRIQEQLAELKIDKSIGVFAGGEKSSGDIVLMTYQSLKAQMSKPPRRRQLKLDQYPLVILDEAHLSLTEKGNEIISELSEDKVVIGCTATDTYNTKRLKGSLTSVGELLGEENRFFDYSIAEAVEKGSLSPVHICMVTTDTSLRWKRSKGQRKKNTQEISEKEAAERINIEKINTVVAEIYHNAVYPNTGEPIFGKQAIAFCAGIAHAKAVADKFNDVFKGNNYIQLNHLQPAAYISGEMTGREQKKILDDYRAGKILMLCGSDILVTGIDNPNASVVFNLRPTRSNVMALQRGGRAVRKSKAFPNKVAMIFEFNWVVDGQVFLSEFLNHQHQLGQIPIVNEDMQKFQTLRREEVSDHFENAARWELDWTGKVRAHSVGALRREAEVKVAPNSHVPVLPELVDVSWLDMLGLDMPELDAYGLDGLVEPELGEPELGEPELGMHGLGVYERGVPELGVSALDVPGLVSELEHFLAQESELPIFDAFADFSNPQLFNFNARPSLGDLLELNDPQIVDELSTGIDDDVEHSEYWGSFFSL